MDFDSREFTHRIKSVSMAKFTADEVRNLQGGGNEVSIRSPYNLNSGKLVVMVKFIRVLTWEHCARRRGWEA